MINNKISFITYLSVLARYKKVNRTADMHVVATYNRQQSLENGLTYCRSFFQRTVAQSF